MYPKSRQQRQFGDKIVKVVPETTCSLNLLFLHQRHFTHSVFGAPSTVLRRPWRAPAVCSLSASADLTSGWVLVFNDRPLRRGHYSGNVGKGTPRAPNLQGAPHRRRSTEWTHVLSEGFRHAERSGAVSRQFAL